GVLEAAADLRLLDEPAPQLGVLGVGGTEHLHRQLAPQHLVLDAVDHADAAAADAAEHRVPGDGLGDLLLARARRDEEVALSLALLPEGGREEALEIVGALGLRGRHHPASPRRARFPWWTLPLLSRD